MKLEDFVTTEIRNIMQFAAAWREHNIQDKDKWPLEMLEWGWFKNYMAYCAKQLEAQQQKEAA